MPESLARCLTWLAAALAFVAVSHFDDHLIETRKNFPESQELFFLPRPAVIKVLSLGHAELVADLVFVESLLYFGDHLGGNRRPVWTENYLNTIISLDPSWRQPYVWAATALLYDGQPITNARVELSNYFLDMGVHQFPGDWELAFMIGCNYLYEFKTNDKEQRAKWRKIGAAYFQHAALTGSGPPWLATLAASLLRQSDQEAALHHLEMVYASTSDEKVRENLRQRLIDLHAKVDFERADRERREFDTAWKATLPYAPPALFALVGSNAAPRLDFAYLAQRIDNQTIPGTGPLGSSP